MYQTYDSSAWIPQSLFDGNLVTQVVVGDVRHDRPRPGRAGGVARERTDVPAYGMAPNPNPREPLSWTVNCLVCHTAEIDGVVVLRRRHQDVRRAVARRGAEEADEPTVARPARRAIPSDARARREREPDPQQPSSRQDRLADARAIDGVRGVARRAVHAAARRRDAGRRRRRPRRREDAAAVAHRGEDAGRPLVHRRQLPRRHPADGVVDGAREGPAVRRARRRRDSADQGRVRDRRPPPAAAAVSVRRSIATLAARGKALFYSDEIGCANCHGVYDGRGNVDWPGVHKDVGTDRARLDVVSDGFVDAFDAQSDRRARAASSRAAATRRRRSRASGRTFPYLHNGSVPTLHHLLGPVSERPRIFEVMGARTFDRERVGQRLFTRPAHERLDRGRAAAAVRRRSQLVQRHPARIGQRGSRFLVADQDGCESTGADRILEDIVTLDAIVIGAGPAGLATSRELTRTRSGMWCSNAAIDSVTPGRISTTASCCTPASTCRRCRGSRFRRETPLFPARAGFSGLPRSLRRDVQPADRNGGGRDACRTVDRDGVARADARPASSCTRARSSRPPASSPTRTCRTCPAAIDSPGGCSTASSTGGPSDVPGAARARRRCR